MSSARILGKVGKVARYSTSNSTIPFRAAVFSKPGAPRDVISIKSFQPLNHPSDGHVQLRMRMAPINPSDINVLQGVYPDRPLPRDNLDPSGPVLIPGNEGVGEVVAVGLGVRDLRKGDRVVTAMPQAGTWSNYMNIKATNVIPIGSKISDVQAATISVSTSESHSYYPSD